MENTSVMQKIDNLPQMSEKFDAILAAFMEAKNEMGSKVVKDSVNPFHKSKYASLGAYLELCEPVLYQHKLILLQCPSILNGFDVLVCTLHHVPSGQWIKSYLRLANPKNDCQGVGSAITYMRRYAIMSMFGLNAEDDDGEANSVRPDKKEKAREYSPASPSAASVPETFPEPDIKRATINKTQVNEISYIDHKLEKEYKDKMRAWVKTQYGVNSLEELCVEDFEKVIDRYRKALKFNEQSRNVA